MTAPEARPGGLDGNARGLMVLVAALAVGFLLLLNTGGGGGSSASSNSPGNTPNTTGDLSQSSTSGVSTTSASPSDREPSEVKVVVLNGSGQAGAAATQSDIIGQSAYTMQTPGNAPAGWSDPTTTYYDTGYQAEAVAIAALLGKGTDTVKPLADAELSGAEGEANVVVVLGTDQPAVDSTTTTTA